MEVLHQHEYTYIAQKRRTMILGYVFFVDINLTTHTRTGIRLKIAQEIVAQQMYLVSGVNTY